MMWHKGRRTGSANLQAECNVIAKEENNAFKTNYFIKIVRASDCNK